jgi:hypothetical protein
MDQVIPVISEVGFSIVVTLCICFIGLKQS